MGALRTVAWWLAIALGTGLLGAPPVRGLEGDWPLSAEVVRGFDPPELAWGAGHRGVDLVGEVGSQVRTPADGVVTFAGMVAGRPVLVVTHGDLRTTLEPVSASVAVGARVARGDAVGVLAAGHQPCPGEACLHWGLKRGDAYLDPLALVRHAHRLLPDSALAEVVRRVRAREAAAAADALAGVVLGGTEASGTLVRPSAGRITSVFGLRLHPIFKEWRMHNGVDLSAPCGTPLYAGADAVVTHMGYDASGGWRLVLAHGRVGGVDLRSVYLHAQGYRVRAGDRVARGELVGTMGTTGWSTGCHLHFSTKVDGRHVDPQRWFG